DNGEFGPASIDIQEWMTSLYRKKLCASDDGVPVNRKVADFRKRFRLEVLAALAAGVGSMQESAGRFWGGSACDLSVLGPSEAEINSLVAMTRSAPRQPHHPRVPTRTPHWFFVLLELQGSAEGGKELKVYKRPVA